METISSSMVANFFINRAGSDYIDDGVYEGVTNLKLQKLLYFAQAVHLGVYGCELFDEEIEAWKFGPVIPSIYKKYKVNKNEAIPLEEVNEDIDDDTKQFLESIWRMFSKYSAYELVSITHDHQPWKQIFYNGNADDNIIPKDIMRNYYRNMYTDG